MMIDEPDSRARNRFFAMSLIRIIGAALMMLGLVIVYGRMDGVPQIAGVALVLLGAAAFALVPRLLARRWRTPE